MQCPRCGVMLPDNSTFCPSCGNTMMYQQQPSPNPYMDPSQSGAMYASPMQQGGMPYADPGQSGAMYPNPMQQDQAFANPTMSEPMYADPSQSGAILGSPLQAAQGYQQNDFGQQGFYNPSQQAQQFGYQEQAQPQAQQPQIQTGGMPYADPSMSGPMYGDPTQQQGQPFGTPMQQADSFGSSMQQADPFGAPMQQPDPFGAPMQQPDLFGTPMQQPDPFGAQQINNPFGAPMQQGQPFGQPDPMQPGQPFSQPDPMQQGQPFGAQPQQPGAFGAPMQQGQPFGQPDPMQQGQPFGSQQPGNPAFASPMKPAFQPQGAQPSPTDAAKAQVAKFGGIPNIATIVLAALALLFALLPWVSMDSSVVSQVNTGVGALQTLGSMTGAQGTNQLNDLKLKDGYCMWEMIELGNSADSYAKLANNLSDLGNALGNTNNVQKQSTDNGMLSIVAMIVWAIALAAAVAGLVMYIISKGKKGMIAGILFVPLALFAIAWNLIATTFDYPVEGAAPFTILCAGCAIATTVVAIIFSRKGAAPKAAKPASPKAAQSMAR